MILITGATGNIGSNIVTQLLKSDSEVHFVALVKDERFEASFKERGVSVQVDNLDDAVSLTTAFSGIDRLLLISSIEQHRFEQHKSVINAAMDAGVKYITFITNQDAAHIKKTCVQVYTIKNGLIEHMKVLTTTVLPGLYDGNTGTE